MSHTSRLGQNSLTSRYNNLEGQDSHGSTGGTGSGGQSQQQQTATSTAAAAPTTTTGQNFTNAPTYHSHRGHRRGHSYGGHITASSNHHVQLEARPSHPTHGVVLLPQHGSVMQKGHRRALSGTMPMVGMGAVAWSSLRELENTPLQGRDHAARGLSPEAGSRPSSPDNNAMGDGKNLKNAPMIQHPGDGEKKPDMDLHAMECGIGPCYLPKCFQVCANIKFFVAILALLVTLQQAVASGYVNSVITTIEARFEIPSRFMGIVASSYEMGNVITVLFVSYLGAKRRIPRWIATGVLVMVLGCIMFTLPHFLSHDFNNPGSGRNSYSLENPLESSSARVVDTPYDERSSHLVSTKKNKVKAGRNSVCNQPHPQSAHFTSGSSNRLNHDYNSSAFLDAQGKVDDVKKEKVDPRNTFSAGCSVEMVEENGKKTTKSTEESYAQPFILFMLAQLLLGCGGSPLFTLGVTFIDDNVPSESSSVYIGIVYAMAAFGPVLGFLTGAWLLSIPDYSSTDTTNPDAQFIGMWWGGFLVVGVLLFVVCLPFFTFPKILPSKTALGFPKAKDEEEEEETENQNQYVIEENCLEGSSVTQLSPVEAVENTEYGTSIKDIPHSIWRLLTNPTYVVTCLGGCMELNIVSGFVVFLPKYLETQFSLGKSDASLYTGGIAIPGACLGIFAGGFIMKKLQLKPSGAAKFVVATNLLCLIGYALFFFLGCENPRLAGATVPYPGTVDPLDTRPLDVNLTSECNSECACDSSLDAQFVCHKGITFFSPCHAGCSVNYTQCTCAESESVIPGKCKNNQCHTLEAFMVILFFMTMTVAITQMPLLMIVMRSVKVEERSFALGFQFVIFRIFGYIPSPIIFGNVIDSACILWSVKKCSTLLPAVSGRCLLYDVQDFRYKYVGVLSGLKLLALALFLYDFFQLRKMEKKEEAAAVALQAENLNLKSNSVISLDKLFEEGDVVGAGNGSSGTATTVVTNGNGAVGT